MLWSQRKYVGCIIKQSGHPGSYGPFRHPLWVRPWREAGKPTVCCHGYSPGSITLLQRRFLAILNVATWLRGHILSSVLENRCRRKRTFFRSCAKKTSTLFLLALHPYSTPYFIVVTLVYTIAILSKRLSFFFFFKKQEHDAQVCNIEKRKKSGYLGIFFCFLYKFNWF